MKQTLSFHGPTPHLPAPSGPRLIHRNLDVFFAIDLGCATNCLPAALPLRLAAVVAAYSCGLKDLIAAFGRYRSPVLDDGLPLFVVHSCSVQSLKDFCGLLISEPQLVKPNNIILNPSNQTPLSRQSDTSKALENYS